METRLLITPLFKNMAEAFSNIREWYQVSQFHSAVQNIVLQGKIENILQEVQGDKGRRFRDRLVEICRGYNIFLKDFVEKDTIMPIPMEKFYKSFWNRYNKTTELAAFLELFEFLQIKSYSEAICESIGSIMNMSAGKLYRCCPGPCLVTYPIPLKLNPSTKPLTPLMEFLPLPWRLVLEKSIFFL